MWTQHAHPPPTTALPCSTQHSSNPSCFSCSWCVKLIHYFPILLRKQTPCERRLLRVPCRLSTYIHLSISITLPFVTGFPTHNRKREGDEMTRSNWRERSKGSRKAGNLRWGWYWGEGGLGGLGGLGGPEGWGEESKESVWHEILLCVCGGWLWYSTLEWWKNMKGMKGCASVCKID